MEADKLALPSDMGDLTDWKLQMMKVKEFRLF